MTSDIRIMLVEDNQEYRKIIAMALKNKDDLELISEFSASEIALRSLQGLSSCKKPNLILLDLRLPGMDGLESLQWFRKALPEAKIMILTQSNNEANVLRAISLGASGYLLKSSTLHQIIDAIHSVMAGGAPIDASVARFILNRLKDKMPKEEISSTLSERELEILNLLSEGKVKKEIAKELSISYATVDTHIRHIYDKLEVRNAPAAVGKAYRLGLFQNN